MLLWHRFYWDHRTKRAAGCPSVKSAKSMDPGFFFLFSTPCFPLLLLRATRSAHRQWAWWKRRPLLPAWRKWSGCSDTWRRSCTFSTGWTSCWPWSRALCRKRKKKTTGEKKERLKMTNFEASTWIWGKKTHQTEPLPSAEPPLCWPPWSSAHPAAPCWCCPDSSALGCRCTTSWFSVCRCLRRQKDKMPEHVSNLRAAGDFWQRDPHHHLFFWLTEQILNQF